MNRIINWIKNELILQFEFYGNYPYVRVGWVWIIIVVLFGSSMFGLTLCVILTIAAIANLLNRY